jgi:putative DNA primase/helicase
MPYDEKPPLDWPTWDYTRPGWDDEERIRVIEDENRRILREQRAATENKIFERRRLQTINAAEVKVQRVQWLWEERFALGKYSVLAGNPGTGKSQLSLDMIARVTRGDSWPDGTRAPLGSALILSAEDDPEDTIVPRLIEAGANLSKIEIVQTVFDQTTDGPNNRGFSLEKDIDLLPDRLKHMGDCAVVVIDPIAAYWGRSNSHNDTDVRSALGPVASVAQEYDVAILGIGHLNKAVGVNAIYRLGGSIAFIAAARCAYLTVKDEEDPSRRFFLPAKNNLGQDESGLAYRIVESNSVSRIEWEPDPITTSIDELLNQGNQADRTEIDEAKDFLVDCLNAGPKPALDVQRAAKNAGIAVRTLQRAKGTMGVKSSKQHFAGRWVWAMPDTKDANHVEGSQPFEVASFD